MGRVREGLLSREREGLLERIVVQYSIDRFNNINNSFMRNYIINLSDAPLHATPISIISDALTCDAYIDNT